MKMLQKIAAGVIAAGLSVLIFGSGFTLAQASETIPYGAAPCNGVANGYYAEATTWYCQAQHHVWGLYKPNPTQGGTVHRYGAWMPAGFRSAADRTDVDVVGYTGTYKVYM